eukprot:526774_1
MDLDMKKRTNHSNMYSAISTISSLNNASNSYDNNELRSLILNEYLDDIFPCDGVTLECADQMDSNANASFCEMKFKMNLSSFEILSQHPSAWCYWVAVSELIHIWCTGERESSPTANPTVHPTLDPTAQPITVLTTYSLETSSKSMGDTHNDDDDYMKMFNDLTTTQFVAGIAVICGIVSICWLIPLGICCVYRRYVERKENSDSDETTSVPLAPPGLPGQSSIELPELPSEQQERDATGKQLEGANRLELSVQDSDGMYVPVQEHTADGDTPTDS